MNVDIVQIGGLGRFGVRPFIVVFTDTPKWCRFDSYMFKFGPSPKQLLGITMLRISEFISRDGTSARLIENVFRSYNAPLIELIERDPEEFLTMMELCTGCPL